MNESAARQVAKERRRKSDFMAKLDASAGPTRVFAAVEGGTKGHRSGFVIRRFGRNSRHAVTG